MRCWRHRAAIRRGLHRSWRRQCDRPMRLHRRLVTGQLQWGGQYRLLLSLVLGHTPSKTEAWIFGDKGTLAFITPNNAEPYLQLGKKGGAMGPLAINPARLGAWRVEEEFVNAVRGHEGVTHTDFVTAINTWNGKTP